MLALRLCCNNRRRLLAIFRRPAASSLNSGTQCRGAPGRATGSSAPDYTLERRSTTATKSCAARAIYYVNRSPEPLRSRVVQLDQNLSLPVRTSTS